MINSSLGPFKNRLRDSHVLGCFSKTTDSSFIEVMGNAGLDFVILDMEHGPIGYETLQRHIMAAEVSNLVSIVRVPGYDSSAIGMALDLGACGIQVPSVSQKHQAEHVVKNAKFFPQGERGVCRFVRAADFSAMERRRYFTKANEAIVVIQLEGKEGLSNFDSIIEVQGIDVIFIGPYDLSQSLGCPGEIESDKVVSEMTKLTVKAREKNIVVGTFCDTPGQLEFWQNKGMKYLAYSVDVGIFLEALKQIRTKSKG